MDLPALTSTQVAAVNTSTKFRDLIPDRGRNLATARKGADVWDVLLHFPGEGTLLHALGLSLTGPRPGPPLPDGRVIPLAVDALTAASVTGGLGPILVGHTGVLDASDAALARLDVSGFRQALRGTRVWLAAVTRRPGAPLGLQTIADPRGLTF